MSKSLVLLSFAEGRHNADAIKHFLNAQVRVADWVQLFGMTYLLVLDDMSATELHMAIEVYYHRNGWDSRGYVVARVNADSVTGSLPQKVWNLITPMRDPQKKLEIKDEALKEAYVLAFAAESVSPKSLSAPPEEADGP